MTRTFVFGLFTTWFVGLTLTAAIAMAMQPADARQKAHAGPPPVEVAPATVEPTFALGETAAPRPTWMAAKKSRLETFADPPAAPKPRAQVTEEPKAGSPPPVEIAAPTVEITNVIAAAKPKAPPPVVTIEAPAQRLAVPVASLPTLRCVDSWVQMSAGPTSHRVQHCDVL